MQTLPCPTLTGPSPLPPSSLDLGLCWQAPSWPSSCPPSQTPHYVPFISLHLLPVERKPNSSLFGISSLSSLLAFPLGSPSPRYTPTQLRHLKQLFLHLHWEHPETHPVLPFSPCTHPLAPKTLSMKPPHAGKSSVASC